MATKTAVLIAGATGTLGFEIAKQLSRQEGVQVNALVRPGSESNPHKQEKLEALRQHNVTLVEGDLLDKNSLTNACQNIEVVISAVNGDANIMVEGQTNLIKAAEAGGVRRFIPSDYSVDYRKLDWGDNYQLNFRKAILTTLQGSKKLSYTLILSGVFMETLFNPFGMVFDFQKGRFKYWGDGETAFNTTSLHDVAAFTAAAALDEGLANQALEIAGDTLTMKELKALYEENTIEVLHTRNPGSVADLLNWIAVHRENSASPNDYLAQQYHYALVSGKGALDKDLKDRYPNLRAISVKEYIRNHYKTENLGVRV
ncbi:NmrA family NAD(P)-binding protein [filamentous cyanobacterium LEGE 11480]|uniref:NmrA family NAD(P)-binding protein n=1 Tax=Romeriopsis navalis LEGE 11480 TaxID=2777977 RepID=A0A928VN40_9CYAN|nr:NmrA family NAD(P)-binding protein [Romeriopsis navalis]MBE9030728.1 NmrA family NAD(P)-binding protein [Romeriopsis navalis LEGE 11480]